MKRTSMTGVRREIEPFKSPYELRISQKNPNLVYEPNRFKYTVVHQYTPDWLLPNGIYVESKGRFMASDRAKMLHMKKQHPEVDIRLLFQRAGRPLYTGSKTTYGAWASKHGFEWAEGEIIPPEWYADTKPIKQQPWYI